MCYLVVKAGGVLGQGTRAGTIDGTHEMVITGSDNSIGAALAIRAARAFLDKLEANLGAVLHWSPAALDLAQEAGAIAPAIDTLEDSAPAESMRARQLAGVFPVAANNETLIDEIADILMDDSPYQSEPFHRQKAREALVYLHAKGLLP